MKKTKQDSIKLKGIIPKPAKPISIKEMNNAIADVLKINLYIKVKEMSELNFTLKSKFSNEQESSRAYKDYK